MDKLYLTLPKNDEFVCLLTKSYKQMEKRFIRSHFMSLYAYELTNYCFWSVVGFQLCFIKFIDSASLTIKQITISLRGLAVLEV